MGRLEIESFQRIVSEVLLVVFISLIHLSCRDNMLKISIVVIEIVHCYKFCYVNVKSLTIVLVCNSFHSIYFDTCLEIFNLLHSK